jgi:hypothetical protein
MSTIFPTLRALTLKLPPNLTTSPFSFNLGTQEHPKATTKDPRIHPPSRRRIYRFLGLDAHADHHLWGHQRVESSMDPQAKFISLSILLITSSI